MGTQTEETDQTAADYLEQALEDLVRPQRTSQALDAMADEIKHRKKELPWGA